MNKIPTAEDFLYYGGIITQADCEPYGKLPNKKVPKIMIEFAKLHVEAALKAANDNAKVEIINWEKEGFGLPGLQPIYSVNSESILTAYPLENIK